MAANEKKLNRRKSLRFPAGAASAASRPRRAPAATQSRRGGALSEYSRLYDAAGEFVRANSSFESSVLINSAIDALGTTTDLNSAFLVPLQYRLFTMDAALHWALFLANAPDRAVREGDAPFSLDAPFDANGALSGIASVYDVGVQMVVWEHFECDSEDEDGSENDEAGE